MTRRKKVKAVTRLQDLGIRTTPDRPKPLRRSTGVRTKLSIGEFWTMLFKGNERLGRSKRMTDTEILRQFTLEFPDRQVTHRLKTSKETVNTYRGLYNRGHMSRGKPPRLQSYRYNEFGEIVSGRTGRVER